MCRSPDSEKKVTTRPFEAAPDPAGAPESLAASPRCRHLLGQALSLPRKPRKGTLEEEKHHSYFRHNCWIAGTSVSAGPTHCIIVYHLVADSRVGKAPEHSASLSPLVACQTLPGSIHVSPDSFLAVPFLGVHCDPTQKMVERLCPKKADLHL
ncbi:UNVERIFIED_CONTAM: hypothetical protein K2H54_050071 [Gekko kuhli]